MICTELESEVLGMGCDMMQIARTTCPTTATRSGKYEGSPMTSGAFATAPSLSFTPTNLPSSPNWTSKFSLLSMYVPPCTAASRANPCMHANDQACITWVVRISGGSIRVAELDPPAAAACHRTSFKERMHGAGVMRDEGAGTRAKGCMAVQSSPREDYDAADGDDGHAVRPRLWLRPEEVHNRLRAV